MRIDSGFLGWGIFLILLGLVPLAVSQGWIDEELVRRAWQLWPLILVGIGVGLVLRRTALEPLGGLLIAGTFGVMLGGLLATGLGGVAFGGCGIGDGQGEAFPTRDGTLADGGELRVQLDCGELTVATGDGDRWSVSGTDDGGVGPDIEDRDGSVEITSPSGRGFFFGPGADWQVTVPTGVALDLSLDLNAGSSRTDLTGARLGEVALSTNAGDMTVDAGGAAELERLTASANAASLEITLPEADVTGSLSANAGSIALCVPAGVGIRIDTSENITASYDFPGLDRSGDRYESPDFDSAETRIELSASANAASIGLNPEDGCDG